MANAILDALGLGELEDTTPENYYQTAVQNLYAPEVGNAKQETANAENRATGAAVQSALQNGITGPAAAGLQHEAVEGAQIAGNRTVNNIEAEQRKQAYNAVIADRQEQIRRQTALETAFSKLGQEGLGLVSGGLGLAGKMGMISTETPFLGGLATALGQGTQLKTPAENTLETLPTETAESETLPDAEAPELPKI